MGGISSFITDPQSMIVLLAALGSFIAILGLGSQFIKSDDLSKRMKTVTDRRAELSAEQMVRLKGNRDKQAKQQKRVDFMRATLEKFNLQNMIASKELRIKLAQAGKRGQNSAVTFGFMRLAVPVVIAGLVGVFVWTSAKVTLDPFMKFVFMGGAAAIGYILPGIVLTNLVQKRQQMIRQAFPDALDLLTICVEAGLSVEASFTKVAEEMAPTAPEIAEEFGLTTAELAFLGDRKQAFMNLAERTGLDATKSLATALTQSERYGTPVSTSLRVLSQDNRDQRMSFAEKKAGALPAQLTVPMILFFLPVLFVVILGPAVIQVMRM